MEKNNAVEVQAASSNSLPPITTLDRKEMKELFLPKEERVQGRVGRRLSSLQEERETFTFCPCSDKVRAYKNLLGTSASFVSVFGAYLGLIALQSSINSKAGLGLASSSIIYATLIISSFFGPGLVKLVGNKYSLIIGYCLLLGYTLSNYYSSWYTLVPGAILNGIGQSPMWIAVFGHPIAVVIKYSRALKESRAHGIALFTAVIAASIKLAQALGSLMSSIILINVEEGGQGSAFNQTNTTISNNEECAELSGPPIEPGPIYYTLISVYVLFDVVGIIIAIVFLDHMGTERNYLSPKQMCNEYLWKNSLVVVKTLLNWKYLLIMPLIILNGVMLGFITGTFPKVYISDCVGIQWIGFVLAVYGVGGVLSSVFTGRIVKFIPQFIVTYIALSTTLGLVLFLLIWERQASFVFLFIFVFLWGMCESVYNSVNPALIGRWFQGEQKEGALSLLQVGIAIGFVISFVGGIYLKPEHQLWIILSFIITASITYTIVFFLTSCDKPHLLPCLYGGEEEEEEEGGKGTEEEEEEDIELRGNGLPWTGLNPLSQRPSIGVKEYHSMGKEKEEKGNMVIGKSYRQTSV